MSDRYRQFLERKVMLAPAAGFDVELDEINPALKPHTRVMIRWGLLGGRRAWFASFGLHKTATQIEAMRLIGRRLGRPTLIVIPLGVRQEFFREARERFTGDYAVSLKFIRSADEIEGPEHIYLTNYETVRDGKLDPNRFVAASLDEASVLRSFGSKTYQTFLSLFTKVTFRFVATATPSPNRYKELVHYAGFLGVMDTGQALTRFFQRNSEKANDLTLYPHKEREFWLWVASWGLFVQRPSDLGPEFSDEGYELPALDVHWHEVQSDLASRDFDRDGQGILIREEAVGVQDAAQEKRNSLACRVAKLMEIRAQDPDAHRIIWHDLESERQALEDAVPGIVTVYGSQELEEREKAIIDFSDGRFAELGAKPVMLGSGTNLQRHCRWHVFLGIGFKFNDFIQAVHRLQRFGQTHVVRLDLIYSEREREQRRGLEAKWKRHEEMVAKMTEIVREYGLSAAAMAQVLTRSIGVDRVEARGENWLVANNDCVDECRRMDTNSVDLIVTSIPFSNHYEYTASYNDFGHTDNDDHFFGQMDFLAPELLRILRPGRLACIHVKDRILFGSVTGEGVPTVNPFHAECIFHYRRHGFQFMGMITVVTDVVRENNQTYRLGYTEMLKDSTKMGVGSPEYILLMRKPQSDRSKGYADKRVVKTPDEYSLARWQIDAHAFWRSSGNRLLTPDELAALGPDILAKVFTEESLKTIYSYESHVRIGEELEARFALPSTFMSLAPGSHRDDVWHDINRMITLNSEQAAKGREKHVCPLQFDIVDRLIERYSMKGETVFDPFGGLFTVPYRALHLGRRGRASELHAGYFLDGVKYLEAKEREMAVPTLFDFVSPVLEATE